MPHTRKKPTQSHPKKKTSSSKRMPAWIRFLLKTGLVLLILLAFYWFAVRPYSYRWKPCYGKQEYGICMPGNYDIHGIDISHHQGDINWTKLAESKGTRYPIRFIFMKATEGGDFSDKRFQRNFKNARKHGFVRGAYHYFNPRTDAKKQADFFIKSVKLEKGDLPPVLDVEVKGKMPVGELQKKIKIWLDRVEAHYGVKPIIYTTRGFGNGYLSGELLKDYPRWIAHYNVESLRYNGKWHFWQHSEKGVLPGIKKKVDLNVFNGSSKEFQQLLIK